MIICAFNDRKTGFKQPFLQANEMEAERTLRSAANDPESICCQYAEDYELWSIGTYDERTGMITNTDHHYIGEAVNYKKVVG